MVNIPAKDIKLVGNNEGHYCKVATDTTMKYGSQENRTKTEISLNDIHYYTCLTSINESWPKTSNNLC